MTGALDFTASMLHPAVGFVHQPHAPPHAVFEAPGVWSG